MFFICESGWNFGSDKTEGNRTEKADERIYETSYDERTGGG